jgi:nitrogen fixation protein FixH
LGVAGICRDAEKVRAIVATGVHALALVLFFFAFAVTIMFALNMPID